MLCLSSSMARNNLRLISLGSFSQALLKGLINIDIDPLTRETFPGASIRGLSHRFRLYSLFFLFAERVVIMTLIKLNQCKS